MCVVWLGPHPQIQGGLMTQVHDLDSQRSHFSGHGDWFRDRHVIQARTISSKGITYGTFPEKEQCSLGTVDKKVCLELLVATLTREERLPENGSSPEEIR